jgi:GR25 family glycosyltransferase involved in LPS biosynthesis
MDFEKVKKIADVLRQPEAEKFYNKNAAKAYDETGAVDIRSPHKPEVIDIPVDWKMNPPKDQTWGLYFSAAGWAQIFVYAIDSGTEWTGRLANAAEDLKSVAMSCVEESLNHEVDFSAPFWDDHSIAYRCSNLCFYYAHSVAARLSEAETQRFHDAIRLHTNILVDFIRSGKWSHSNHLIFHIEGIADAWALFQNEIPELDEAMALVQTEMERFIDESISDEGTTSEHASFYQAFLMGRISETAKFFERIGKPLAIDVDARMKRGAAFLWNIMPRWGILPPFGDTQFQKALDFRHVKKFTEEPWIGPEYRQWHEPDTNIIPAPLTSYRQNGFHIFRMNPAASPRALYSLFLERPFRGPHGHWDGNTFMTYYGGEPFLVDSGGPYKYGDTLRYKYFQTQLAHNSVIFDKKSGLKTRVTSLGTSEGLSWAVGLGEFTDGTTWVRIFAHVGDANVVMIDVAGASSQPMETPPVALFHLAPGLEPETLDDTVRINGGKVPAQMSFCRMAPVLPRADNGPFQSMVTSVDTRYDEAPLLSLELEPYVPQMGLLSFDGSRAVSVERREGECRFVLDHPDRGAQEIVIAIDPEALGAMVPPVRDVLQIINLDHDLERWAKVGELVGKTGHQAERVGGVRGLYLPNLAIQGIPGASKVARGTLGCFLSHLSAWEKIASGAQARGFIAEDDVDFASWMRPGLLQQMTGNDCDLIFCNRRMLEEEKWVIPDRTNEPVTVQPLFPVLMTKPVTFRAPGGEGYILSRNGARKLIDLVSRFGIHGDVDWFMVVMSLSDEERKSFAAPAPLERHCRKLPRIYGAGRKLNAGVMSPWMIRHAYVGSSRKIDDTAYAEARAV